jgi:hypothetical protein
MSELNLKLTPEEQAIMDKHTLSLQGKDYTQVNARAYVFRLKNSGASVVCDYIMFNEQPLARCVIAKDGLVLAQAHKMVKVTGGKGAAAQYPYETAQTGALGRALALVGFGTLTGELEEHDQIADAPIQKPGPKPKASNKTITNLVR